VLWAAGAFPERYKQLACPRAIPKNLHKSFYKKTSLFKIRRNFHAVGQASFLRSAGAPHVGSADARRKFQRDSLK